MAEDRGRPGQAATRREFCLQACQAASLMALGALAQSCGGDGGGGNLAGPSGVGGAPALPVLNAAVANGTVSLGVSGTPLDAVGNAALVRTSGGDLLLARTAQEAFVALTATCTHEACTITGFRDQVFVCPCHGSQFNTSGGVVNGPATRSLRQFTTQFAGDTLTIDL